MIFVGNTVEGFHRELEERDGLTEVTLQLNGRTHIIFLPADGSLSSEDKVYLLQRASSLRWVAGPGKLTVMDSLVAQKVLDEAFSQGGDFAFEAEVFDNLDLSAGPSGTAKGEGSQTVFFDIGGSSLKSALFSNGQLARQHSMSWEPFKFTSMPQLTAALEGFLLELLAARSAENVSHVGVSSAGLCHDGALLASTLTQGMEFPDDAPYDPWFIKRLIQRLFSDASFDLMNDGEVTALPYRKENTVTPKRALSLVMGSNLGGGYYPNEELPGVHEMGFIPVLNNSNLADEWSGYRGIASEVFSKKGLLWLAEQQGYSISEKGSERGVIEQLHTDLRHGFRKSRLVFQELGAMLAPFIAYLQRYYEIDTVLLSGGILTESVVDEMQEVYQASYKALTDQAPPPLQMLVVPGILPEYNQVWTLASHYFSQNSCA